MVAKDILLTNCPSSVQPAERYTRVVNAPWKKFFNLIQKWYALTKRAGMFPLEVEDVLNRDARQIGI